MTNKNKLILGGVVVVVGAYFLMRDKEKEIIPGKLYKTDIGF